MPPRLAATAVSLVLGAATLAACGDAAADDSSRPTIVVTTSIVGDVVTRMVGDDARVQVVMPAGTDPHEFQASAQQVDEMRSADVLVTNGGDFEAGLHDAIEAAEEDVTTVHALDFVETLPFGDHDHDHEGDDHADEGDDHADDDHADEGDDHADEAAGEEDDHDHDHDHGDVDPHLFTDPDRMADAAEGIADALADEVPALAADAARERAAAVVTDLRTLAGDVEDVLAAIPAERRVLVTNHDVFGYFADRYDFTVVGVVVSGGGTGGEPSGADLDALAAVVEDEEVPAIFADVSSPSRLADALAAEVGGAVEVVALHTESLGDEGSGAETYDEMMRTDAERIAAALG